ncbi:MAG: SRPBCC family protein [Planctomycetota bacterium]
MSAADQPPVPEAITFERDGRDFVCLAQQWLPRKPHELFRFFGDCRHMNFVLPPFIRFEVLGDMPPLAEGVTYDYRLKLHGIPLRWTTRIGQVEAPHWFEDFQQRGPYSFFVHRHEFVEQDGGTLTRDRITYRPPGGPLAPLINRLTVQRDLRKLFEHRHVAMRKLYEADADPAELFDALEPGTYPTSAVLHEAA